MKKILLILFMLMLFATIFEDSFVFFRFKPLAGAIVNPTCDSLKKENWFNGEYQELRQDYLTASFGFRNFLVRANNQFRFNLFKKPEPKGVVVGKEDCLYEKNYIEAYTGLDFVGEDSITHTINRLKFISDTLDKLGKKLIVLINPGKASYYPEFIPDNLMIKTNKTNYHYLAKGLIKSNIHHIDFNKYFMENKTKSKYPLYPKCGIHWSLYGATLAADSLLKKMQLLSNTKMPELIIKKVTMMQPGKLDYDIAEAMNLFTRFESPDLAYPKIEYRMDNSVAKQNGLFISDSFFWTMGETGFASCFKEFHFWYYNHQIYPETTTNELLTKQIKMGPEVLKNDFVVIMASEPNLKKIGWNFIEELYSYFKGNDYYEKLKIRNKEIDDMINYIKTDKKWYKDIKEKAELSLIPIDSALYKDAIWAIDNKK